MTFLFSMVSLYYSCSSANKQTRFHVHGMQRASLLDRFVKFAFAQSFAGSVT